MLFGSLFPPHKKKKAKIIVSHQKNEIKSYNYEIQGHTCYIKIKMHNYEGGQNLHKIRNYDKKSLL